MDIHKFLSENGPEIEKNGVVYDEKNQFAEANFQILKESGMYNMLIPAELGGAGVTYSEVCYFIKDLAKHDPATALTFSMHMHLVAVLTFKHLNGDEGSSETLRAVTANDFILLSTGGGDWVSSNGSAKRTEDGYIINCTKSFCSGSPIANIAVMSCAFDDGVKDHVIHFSVPLTSDGIEIRDDWNAMGMKATGSNSIIFKDVYIPDKKVSLIRERGKWHPVWDVVATFAFPIFIAPYAGIIEAITERTIANFSDSKSKVPCAVTCLGEMHNNYQVTKLAFDKLVNNANNLDLKPDSNTASIALQAKALITKHGRASAQSAMEALGGYSYFHKPGIERLYRDLLAGEFHPMQSSKQQEMQGNYLLGKTLAG